MSDPRLLAALRDPACFPHAPADVQLVQTHLSIVCLAGDLVYKLKKSVTLPFVDFAPLAARRQACRDEVRLNRRLCPDVYLGTASLRPAHADADADAAAASTGEVTTPRDPTLPHGAAVESPAATHAGCTTTPRDPTLPHGDGSGSPASTHAGDTTPPREPAAPHGAARGADAPGAQAPRPDDGTALRFAATGDDEHADDVDVAVVMRRLPQERMLDELLRAHAVSPAEIEALARHVAAFHAACERPDPERATATATLLAGFAAANFTEILEREDHGLPPPLLRALQAASAADFARLLPRLSARARAGRVVDGHGDLHARNVCMTTPPAVYDCIEFEPRFRIGDVATENAFLAMDLRHRGAPELARVYVAAHAAASGDTDQIELLPTLCGYRAMVRAKVAGLAAADAGVPAADRAGARDSAWRHLALAAAYALEQRSARWLVLCGPPASGKSRLAGELAAATGWPVLATDLVRKELAGVAAHERARAEHYTPAFSQRTYTELATRAAAATAAGHAFVVLDGNFAEPERRLAAAAAARAAGAEPLLVHVAIDVATAVARAAARAHEGTSVSDADADVARARHAAFVVPAAAEGTAVLRLDGTHTPRELATAVLTELLANPQPEA